MPDPNKKTRRTLDGRLFPPIEIGPFRISAQAGLGYQSTPRVDLPSLEDFEAVEIKLYAEDRIEPVDPSTFDMPESILKKFSPLDASGGPSIAGNVTHDELEQIRQAIINAAMRSPNAGYPRGYVSWPRRQVFHGTSTEAAQSINDGGIDMRECGVGYFGEAFYVADDEELARSNYAEFSDDEGAVIKLEIAPGARILDMRNPLDSDEWSRLVSNNDPGRTGFAEKAMRKGVDGVYDRSVGGLAIYNPDVVEIISVDFGQELPTPTP